MPVRVTCPECGASRDAKEDQRGKKVPCRKCETLIRVPARGRAAKPEDDLEIVEEVEAVEEVEEVEAVEEVEEAPPVKKKFQKRRDDEDDTIREAPPKKKKVPPPPAKSQKRRDDEDEEEDRPRGKKGKKTKERSSGATIAIAAVLIVVIVAGLATGAYFLFKGDKDNSVANTNPSQGPPNGLQMPGMPGAPNPGGGTPHPGGGTPHPGGDPVKPKGPPKGPPDPVPVAGPPQISRSTIYNYVLKSTAWIITKHLEGGAMGTGSLIDRDNRLVLTNYHVVRGMVDFVVFFPVYSPLDHKLIEERNVYLAQAKREDAIKGKVVAHDKDHDLALIQLDRVPDGVEPLPFAKAEPSKGDEVHSIGNPGASGSLWVYTHGLVRSVYHKEWMSGNEEFVMKLSARVVETDSPTNPGDSGGPCVNERGELVGVTQGGSRTANAIALFISSTEAELFIGKAFKASPLLAGKTWSRSQRPTLVAAGGGVVTNLPVLVAKLGSPNDTVRAQGAEGLALLGPDARLALPELVKALGDKNAFVRRLVAHALRQVGQPNAKDIPDLLPALDSASPEARIYVLEALAVLGGTPDAAAGAPAVLKAAEDPDARVRYQAMRAVGRMAAPVGDKDATPAISDKDATAVLEKGLQDADKKVRAAAAESLAADVPSVKNSLPKLIALLKRKEPEVRVQAAKAIGRLGEKGKPATRDLLDAVRGDNRQLRKAGFVALKSVKATPQELVPVLRGGIKDEDVEVRRAALEAAGKAGAAAKDLVPVIVDALADSDVRSPALLALKKLGPDARDGAAGVANLLTTDRTMRMDTLSTLEAMKLSGSTLALVVPKLIEVFGDEKQPPIRDKAAEVLASIGKPIIPDLCKLLLNPKPEMRSGAAASLGAMGRTAQGASATLQAAIQRERDAGVRDKELAALRRINAVPPAKP